MLNPIGFARLTKEQHRQIARKGGKASQAGGHAHKFTSESGRAAGKRGGRVSAWSLRKRGEAAKESAERIDKSGEF